MYPSEISQELLDGYKDQYENSTGGDRVAALFSAILFCGSDGIVIPECAFKGFLEATGKWFDLEVNSLDEAFGVKPLPDTTRKNRARNRDLMFKVFARVLMLKKQGKPIPWDKLAKDFGASKSKLQDLYYKMEKSVNRHK
jgi:hypothetical protein